MAMSRKLPDEMIEEIVSWMPVKSVGQFRRVSKKGVLEGDLFCTFVDVYSTRIGFWRRLESISHNGASPIHDFGVFLNGTLHWLAVAPGKAKLIIYNKKKEQQREMNVDGITSKCIRIRTFMESLVSPMIGKETEGSDYIA
ncbi:hypothetical protein KY285_001102 [Solanum tuberosum]|nr:hypothetical protein KY285_001102 [Solanum tuberosum]